MAGPRMDSVSLRNANRGNRDDAKARHSLNLELGDILRGVAFMMSSDLIVQYEVNGAAPRIQIAPELLQKRRRSIVTGTFRKVLTAALAASIFGASVLTDTTSSAAQGWHGAAWRGGYWGRGGWGWRGWGGSYGNWGGAVAAGVVGGLALGALAGAAYPYGPYYWGGCSWQNRPVYDAWGNFAGYAPVQVCY
jgi:hypothetical protein